MEQLSQPSLFEVSEPGLSWPNILIPAALEEISQDRGRLILFRGHRGLFPLGHYLMVWRRMQEEAMVVVDGANFFDLTLITRLGQRHKKDARRLLQGIHISRAFTVHQLEAVISERLEGALKKQNSRLSLISGLLDTFSDEEVPLWEAIRILRKVIGRLRCLADQGNRVIVLAPDPPVPVAKRRGFGLMVIKIADRVFTLSETEGLLTMKEETRVATRRQWVFPALQRSRKQYPAR
jgi:hypothetical protein